MERNDSLHTPCMLSIIVPTYNSSNSIVRCLESIGKQTFLDYEVVVQDNNSTDGTVELVRTFQDAWPDVVIRWAQESDCGAYDAMNKAMQRSRGEWLLFLGSDDALHDGAVLARVMLDPQTTTADFVYGNVEIVGDTPWAAGGSIYDGRFSLDKFLTTNICHQAIFYRSSLAKSVGLFNTKYPVCADYDFNMRCWSRTKFLHLDVVVAYFYSGGISSRVDEAFAADYHANVRRYGLLDDLPFRTKASYIWTGLKNDWVGKAHKLVKSSK